MYQNIVGARAPTAWSITQCPILLCETLRERLRSVQVPNTQCPMPNAH
ncbi:hypothetical protein H6G41_13510 [Tolypothrix sp. FACHB-123]|nr:hypothetical protein [Tolypothrix sp. FACHB-123]MBD2355621.1 hypothetical protein [Tolypothrix sp. FACHB-123]